MSATQRVVSQTGTKSFTQGVVLECSGVDSLPSCRSLAFLASHDILETAGWKLVEARVPYMEGWSASGLTACLPSKR